MKKLTTLLRDTGNWLFDEIVFDPLYSMALYKYLLTSNLVAWALFTGLSNKFKTSNSLFVHKFVLSIPNSLNNTFLRLSQLLQYRIKCASYSTSSQYLHVLFSLGSFGPV